MKRLMNKEGELTQEVLKELLHYDPESGVFTWREREMKWFKEGPYQISTCSLWNGKFAGRVAGSTCTISKRGLAYRTIYDNKKYIYLGCYSDLDEAIQVRKKAEIDCGFHPNHGRI